MDLPYYQRQIRFRILSKVFQKTLNIWVPLRRLALSLAGSRQKYMSLTIFLCKNNPLDFILYLNQISMTLNLNIKF